MLHEQCTGFRPFLFLYKFQEGLVVGPLDLDLEVSLVLEVGPLDLDLGASLVREVGHLDPGVSLVQEVGHLDLDMVSLVQETTLFRTTIFRNQNT